MLVCQWLQHNKCHAPSLQLPSLLCYPLSYSSQSLLYSEPSLSLPES
jgi:hypothetical protein